MGKAWKGAYAPMIAAAFVAAVLILTEAPDSWWIGFLIVALWLSIGTTIEALTKRLDDVAATNKEILAKLDPMDR